MLETLQFILFNTPYFCNDPQKLRTQTYFWQVQQNFIEMGKA